MESRTFSLGIAIGLRDAFTGPALRIVSMLGTMKDTATQARRDMEKALGGIRTSLLSITAGIGVIASLGYLGRAAVEFQHSLREIQTIADTSRTSIAELNKEVKKLAMTYGEGPVDQANALYWTISSGILDAVDATKLLHQANKLAIGGSTTAYAATDVLTTIINAYGLKVKDARRLSDELFTTVKYGKMHMQDLATSLGMVIPSAANLGISTQELNAAIATLTTGGLSASQAVQYLRQGFGNIIKVTKTAQVEAKKLGLDFSAAKLQSMGLYDFLMYVKETIDAKGGDRTSMAKLFATEEDEAAVNAGITSWGQLFRSQQAIQAMLALTGKQANKFREVLNAMTLEAGATDRAFRIMYWSLENQEKLLKSNAQTLRTSLGEAMIPILATLTVSLRLAIQGITWLFETFPPLKYVVVAATVALGALLIYLGVLKAKSIIAAQGPTLLRKAFDLMGISITRTTVAAQAGQAATTAFGITFAATGKVITITAAQIQAALWQVVLITVAIVAAVKFLRYIWDTNWAGIRERVERTVAKIRAVVNGLRIIFENLNGSISIIPKSVKDELEKQGLWDITFTLAMWGYRIKQLLEGISAGFKGVWEGIAGVFAAIGQVLKPLLDFISSLISTVAEKIFKIEPKEDTASKWKQVGTIIGAILGTISVLLSVILVKKLALASVSGIGTLIGWIGKLGGVVGKVASGFTSVFSFLKTGLTTLFAAGPWGWIIGAVVALAAGIYMLIKNFDKLPPAWQEFFGPFVTSIKEIWGKLVPALRTIGQGLLAFLKPIIEFLGMAIGSIFSFIGSVVKALEPLTPVFKAIFQFTFGVLSAVILGLLQMFQELVSFIADRVVPVFEPLGRVIGAVANFLWSLVKGVFAAAQGIVSIVANIFNPVKLWNEVIPSIGQSLEGVGKSILDGLKNLGSSIVDFLKTLFSEGLVNAVKGAWQGITNWWARVTGKAPAPEVAPVEAAEPPKPALVPGPKRLKPPKQTPAPAVPKIPAQTIAPPVSSLPKTAAAPLDVPWIPPPLQVGQPTFSADWIPGAFTPQITPEVQAPKASGGITGFFKGIFGKKEQDQFKAAGQAIPEAIADGIRQSKDLYTAMEETFDGVSPLLPHSDAKKGPLSKLTAAGRAIIAAMAAGVTKSPELADSLQKTFEDLGLHGPTRVLTGMRRLGSAFSGFYKQLYDRLHVFEAGNIKRFKEDATSGLILVEKASGFAWDAIKRNWVNAEFIINKAMVGAKYTATRVWEGLKALGPVLWDIIVQAGKNIWETSQSIWNLVKEFGVITWEVLVSASKSLWEDAKKLWDLVKEFGAITWEVVVSASKSIWEDVNSIWEGIKKYGNIVWNVVLNFGSTLIESAKDKWSQIVSFGAIAWDILVDTAEQVIESGKKKWESIKNLGAITWDVLIEIGSQIVEGAKNTAHNLWQDIKNFGAISWNVVVNAGEEIWEGLKSGAATAWEGIKSIAAGAWDFLLGRKTQAPAAPDITVTDPTSMWTAFSNAGIAAWTAIKTAAATEWNNIRLNWMTADKFFSDSVWTPVNQGSTKLWGNVTTGSQTALGEIKKEWAKLPGELDQSVWSVMKKDWQDFWNLLNTPIKPGGKSSIDKEEMPSTYKDMLTSYAQSTNINNTVNNNYTTNKNTQQKDALFTAKQGEELINAIKRLADRPIQVVATLDGYQIYSAMAQRNLVAYERAGGGGR